MEVRNISKSKYFRAVDGCKITELFGIPTYKLKEVSFAYAILPPKNKTAEHLHRFLEIYAIIKGRGIMYLKDGEKKVSEGDSILIPKNSSHCIENTGNKNLEFYCICVPSFTEKGTVMRK